MPYIVTTRRDCEQCRDFQLEPCLTPEVSRRAVATLKEASEAALNAVTAMYDALLAAGHDFSPKMRDLDFYGACERLPESGGTVGPLPDGSLIEVESVGAIDLFNRAGLPKGPPYKTVPEVIDAYNAKQEGLR